MIGKTNVSGSAVKAVSGSIRGSGTQNLVISNLDFFPKNMLIISENYSTSGTVISGRLTNYSSGYIYFYCSQGSDTAPNTVRVTITYNQSAKTLTLYTQSGGHWLSSVTYYYIIKNDK